MDARLPRQQKRIAISLTIELEASSGNREARMSDLSMNGCYIDTITSVRLDENVRFTLSLPDGRREELSGEVIYMHEGIGFGLRFNDLSDDQRMLLQKIIQTDGAGFVVAHVSRQILRSVVQAIFPNRPGLAVPHSSPLL